jgi:hypothetical protein
MSIIAINGYSNSGKDLVGRMIQYLTSTCSNQQSNQYRTFDQFINAAGGSDPRNFDHHYQTDWEIKKFAGKLKDIASMLTGIPKHKFEDQEFKKTKLGPEWKKIYIQQLDKRSNTVLDFGPYETEQEARTEIATRMRSLKRKDLYGYVQFTVVKKAMTVRDFLQKLGTDGLRDGLHQNVWVNALFADYDCVPADQAPGGWDCPNWIITDCRFPNEAKAVKERQGIILRVNRPGVTAVNAHPSETSLDGWNFDAVIDNDGDVSSLLVKVKTLLEEQTIIV